MHSRLYASSRRSRLLRWSAASIVAATVAVGLAPKTYADNNKGTIKISLDGTIELPAGGSNEPKVGCLPFYVQGYKLVQGDNITISFYDQGGANNKTFVGSQTTTTTNFGTTANPNYGFNAKITATSLSNNGSPATLAAGGHYEVDITDDQNAISDSDKSKVFKIDDTCVINPPEPSATPELSSTELVGTGVVTAAGLVLLRRRRKRNN